MMRQYLSFWLPFGYHKVLNERYLKAWQHHDNAYGMFGHPDSPDRLAADLKLVRDLTLMGASRWTIWPTYIILRIFFGKYWQEVKQLKILTPEPIHRTDDVWRKAYAFYRVEGVTFVEASEKAYEVFYTDREEMRRLNRHEEM